MKSKTLRSGVAGLAAIALVLSGCGRDDDSDTEVAGITEEPCPNAVDESNGCIYLGAITDLTGPFSPIGAPMIEGAQAYWQNVNENGGIDGYEVDMVTHVRDSGYNETTHSQEYWEIRDQILVLAHSLGTAHTNGILDDTRQQNILAVPASLGSNWLFEDGVLEFGTSYCAEAMNMVDYAVDELDATSVGMVHFPGDYGDDAANGAEIAAEERDVEFTRYTTAPGGTDEQTAVIQRILADRPDVVLLATSAIETGAIVGATVAQGYEGQFIGSTPTWSAGLMGSQAAPALEARYRSAATVAPWGFDSEGHNEMREFAESIGAEPNDWFVLGWAAQTVIRGLLQQAIENDDLTRAGVFETADQLTGLDTDGMFAEGAGDYSGEVNEHASRSTIFNRIEAGSPTGLVLEEEWYEGPTAADFEFTEACYLM
ncbi:branched-chain amino acid ABC transporter substrate-binding protein [Dietzia sp. UCD-THP]|uniref:ABC transporter substrate-binding protein n=1 Tax=Dietzia sp. UCD-THP TaxID=1292020 RepID=UPI000360DBD9|nr:ABC transporter substrate-binding protein [Dietzia sp. UCD-THP]EYT62017.1 branched-chain amino acid ABC transporter substrate-binding protein [Dietzia sp. UCD-THP]